MRDYDFHDGLFLVHRSREVKSALILFGQLNGLLFRMMVRDC